MRDLTVPLAFCYTCDNLFEPEKPRNLWTLIAVEECVSRSHNLVPGTLQRIPTAKQRLLPPLENEEADFLDVVQAHDREDRSRTN